MHIRIHMHIHIRIHIRIHMATARRINRSQQQQIVAIDRSRSQQQIAAADGAHSLTTLVVVCSVNPGR